MADSVLKSTADKQTSTLKQGSASVERKLAPGIYFTPAPKRSDVASGIPEPPEVENMTREELESEYRSTTKSIEKLGESNGIMKQCDPNGEDPVLVQAIRENTDIIVRRKLRMVLVKARLDYFIRSQPHVRSSRIAPQSSAEAVPSVASSLSTASSTTAASTAPVPSAATGSAPSSQPNSEPAHDPAVHGLDL